MNFSLLFLSFIQLVYSPQEKIPVIEQMALNYFAEHILPMEKNNDKFLYDGKVTKCSPDSNSIKTSLYLYYSCRKDSIDKRYKKPSTESYILDYEDIDLFVKKFEPNSSSIDSVKDLSIPIPLRKIGRIKISRTGGSWGKFKKLLFGIDFYLTVYQKFETNGIYFVEINASRTYDTSGWTYFILVDSEGKILDWCKSFWIS